MAHEVAQHGIAGLTPDGHMMQSGRSPTATVAAPTPVEGSLKVYTTPRPAP